MESFPTWHYCSEGDMPENYREPIQYTFGQSEYTPIVLLVLPDFSTTSACRKRTLKEEFFKWVQNYSMNDVPKVIKKKGEPIMWTFYPEKEYFKELLKNKQ